MNARLNLDALEKRFTGKLTNCSAEMTGIVLSLIALVRTIDAELARYGSDNARLRAIEKAALRTAATIGVVLAANGCDCDCGHDAEGHDDACERCLGCRICAALGTQPPPDWSRE